MKLRILPTLLLLPTLALAQTAVGPASEPHYRLLLQNDQVRVFAVTLHAGESAFVRHQHSFMTVTLQDAEIVMWQGTRSPIQQEFPVHQGEVSFVSLTPLTPQAEHNGAAAGLRNDRQSDYTNITVEFLDPTVAWAGGGEIDPPVDPQVKFANSMSLGRAIVADVQLLAGASFPAPDKRGPQLLIPVTEVDLKGVGETDIRRSAGEVAWIPASQTSALSNAASARARFVIVEFQGDKP